MSEQDHVEELLAPYVNGSLDEIGRRRADAHLAECETCSTSLAAWTSIREGVRTSAPAPPGYGLLDRVFAEIDGVGLSDGSGDPVEAGLRGAGNVAPPSSVSPMTLVDAPTAPAPPTPAQPAPAPPVVRPLRPRRGPPLALVVLGTAAAVLVVVGLVVGRTSDGPPERREVLLAAAASTREAGTARLSYEGTFELDLDPGLPGLPADAGPVVAEVSGEGEVVLPDRSRTRVGFEIVQWPLTNEDRPEGSVTETIRIGDTTYSRDGGDPFSVSDDEPGGLVSTAFFSTDLAGLLEHAEDGDIRQLDDEERDGWPVRHYRFPVPDSAFPDLEDDTSFSGQTYTIDAFVDDDERVAELRVRSVGRLGDPPGEFRVDVTIQVTDVGAAVSVEPPDPDELED